jgi:hypothetical protein
MRTILVTVSVFALLAVPALGADEFADEVKEACKEFKSNFKKQPDAEATAGIDKLLALYKNEKADEKLKKQLVVTIGAAVSSRSDDVVIHTLKTLGETDENAVKFLERVLKVAIKTKPPQADRYEACFASLGKLASPKSIKTLTGYLKNKDYDVIAQSANALVGYKDVHWKLRKDIFEELLKIAEGLYSSANSNPSGEPAKKWRVIGTSMMDGMNAVSRQKLSDPAAARRWFNDNKKKNWDKLDQG